MVKVLLEGEEVFLMIRGEEYSRLWSRYFVYWSGGQQNRLVERKFGKNIIVCRNFLGIY